MRELQEFQSFIDQQPTVADPDIVIDGMVAVVMRGSTDLDGGGSARVSDRPVNGLVSDHPISGLVEEKPVVAGSETVV